MPDGALSRHADWARRWVPFALGLVAIGLATKSETPVDHPFGNANSRDEPGAMQAARAMEAGRGRSALAPWAIPWRGWKDILWRTYAQILEDRLFSLAGGVVFYAILALFPAVTAVVSLFGLFSKGSAISDTLSAVATIIPGDAVGIINDQVIRVAATSGAKLSFGFVLGIAFALWSANAGTKAVMDALNVVYEETEKRGLIKLNVVSLGFTAGAIVAVLLALGFVVLFPVALAGIGLGTFTETIVRVFRWPALLVLVMAGVAATYRYGPSRRVARWEWLSVGSVAAGVLWLLGSVLFSWYLSSFADYNATYGTLGAVIGMMMWMWVSVLAILIGAELNSEIEHQTARDSTVGAEKPLGERGATMADTVGEAVAGH